MGSTVDIICNVKSFGQWKFKQSNLPRNTKVGYNERGMLLRISKITQSNIGQYTCYTEVKDYISYYDIVNVEIAGKCKAY